MYNHAFNPMSVKIERFYDSVCFLCLLAGIRSYSAHARAHRSLLTLVIPSAPPTLPTGAPAARPNTFGLGKSCRV